MTNETTRPDDLKNAVIRICPACGVVNPAGPSDACPHLQLVKFQGIDASLESQLERLAVVRNEFWSLISQLRATVMHAVQQGDAAVEVTHKGRVSDVNRTRKHPSPLVLSNPEPSEPPKAPKRAAKQKSQKPPIQKQVDPRQLALIAREPPQGDA